MKIWIILILILVGILGYSLILLPENSFFSASVKPLPKPQKKLHVFSPTPTHHDDTEEKPKEKTPEEKELLEKEEAERIEKRRAEFEDEYIPKKPVIQIEGDWIKLGKLYKAPKEKEAKLVDIVRVNPKTQVVEIEGEVCINQGLIELFACTERGKTHESVIVSYCSPSHLQAGLMMLGLTPLKRGEFPGDPDAKPGSLLDIEMSWKVKDGESEKTVTYPIYELVLNTQKNAPMEKQHWEFIGSFFSMDPMIKKEVYVADVSGTLITTWTNPDTVIDSTSLLKEDDTIFFANHHLLPEPGTLIILRIKPAKIEEKK